jgi:hypothetical protein
MDFFRARLDRDVSTSAVHSPNRLYPRVPALFEPIAPRVDVAPSEESVEVNESVHEEIPPRATPQIPAQEIPRTREPYRGIMHVPPTQHDADASAAALTQNNAPHNVHAPVENANESPAQHVEPETRAQSARRIAIHAPGQFHATRGETETVIPSIRPAPISESRLPEARAETIQDTQAQTAPVIRVHIGSIVVRAVSQPSPAPPPREMKSKKMPLDEYLKKRARGEH